MPPRRRSAVATRQVILTAANVHFRERGFAGASVRGIAAAVDVDPALVIRYFGTKEQLFVSAMALTIDDVPQLSAPLEQLGEALVGYLLEIGEPTRGVWLALTRGSGQQRVAEHIRAKHEKTFVAPLRARLTGPDADLRARLAASLAAGLLYSIWVIGDEAVLAADRDLIISRYGALIQELMTPRPPAQSS